MELAIFRGRTTKAKESGPSQGVKTFYQMLMPTKSIYYGRGTK